MKLYKGFSTHLIEGLHQNIFFSTPRQPLDTPNSIHQLADEWFNSRFGIKGRTTTLICSTCISQAKSYSDNGTLAEIIPTPPFKLLYSQEVKDFLSISMEISEITKHEVALWLLSKDYRVIDSQEQLPNFLGEVMVECESFTLKHLL